jgi:hypothetical protein
MRHGTKLVYTGITGLLLTFGFTWYLTNNGFRNRNARAEDSSAFLDDFHRIKNNKHHYQYTPSGMVYNGLSVEETIDHEAEALKVTE